MEHDELLNKAWEETFVGQATLKKGISALRQILAENPENEYIKTIPRRGYSFVSRVRVVPDKPPKSGLYNLPSLGGESRRIKENVAKCFDVARWKKNRARSIERQNKYLHRQPEGEDERAVSELPVGLSLLGISLTPDAAAVLCTVRKVVENKPLYYVSEISAENGNERVVVPPQKKNIIGTVWLPDNSAVLVTQREPNADLRQIWQFLPASQEWRRVTNDNNSYKYTSLTRGGKNIVTVQESRLAAIWVMSNLAIEKNRRKRNLCSTIRTISGKLPTALIISTN